MTNLLGCGDHRTATAARLLHSTGPRRWGHSMNDKPRNGRILRDLRQVELEELERMAKFDKWVEEMRQNGCPDPEDPVVLAKWQAEQDQEFEEFMRSHR